MPLRAVFVGNLNLEVGGQPEAPVPHRFGWPVGMKAAEVVRLLVRPHGQRVKALLARKRLDLPGFSGEAFTL